MSDTASDSFTRIALPLLDTVYRVALSLSRDATLAEDLTQITFAKGLKRFVSFRQGTNVKAWLLRILHNTWIDELRHRKVVGPVSEIEEQAIPDVSEAEEAVEWFTPQALIERFSDAQVISALQDLPEDQRLTLLLVDVEQMSHEEAAEVLDIAVGTVKSRTSRARRMLKDRLHEHAVDLGFTGRRT
jgi:RNA polymerase sigma-70 factor, ECF subfamily